MNLPTSIVASLGLLSLTIALAPADPPSAGVHHAQIKEQSIQSCIECIRACRQCLVDCDCDASEKHCLTCVETCRACIALMEYDSPLCGEMCSICEKACDACANACRECAMRTCQEQCAGACEKCRDACRAMAESSL
jgi:hypothetical protein